MNKWLYRAVGAVGVASGTLLMSSGVAHAQHADVAKPTVDPQVMRGLVADLFTPTGGQQHLGLSIDVPESQNGGREELIGGLLGGGGGANPLGALTSGLTSSGALDSLTGGLGGGDGGLLGGLTSGLTSSGALDSLTGGLGNGLLGGGGPLGSLTSSLGTGGDPLSAVTGGLTPGRGAAPLDTDTLDNAVPGDGPVPADGAPAQAGAASEPPGQADAAAAADLARQINQATGPMLRALITDAVAKKVAEPIPAPVEEIGGLPVVGPLLGPDGPLGQFLVVGEFANGLPLVGDVLKGNLDPSAVTRLPVVRQVMSDGLLKMSDTPGLPVVGGLPLVGDALNQLTAATAGKKTQAPPTTLPALNGQQQPAAAGTNSLGTNSLGTNSLGINSLGTNLLGGNPLDTNKAKAPAAGAQAAAGKAKAPIHAGKHRATDRPEIVDPEYLESGSLPLVGSLTSMDGIGTLPLSTLMRNVPLVNDMPLVGELDSPLRALKNLPLVSSLAGLVPVESDTAA